MSWWCSGAMPGPVSHTRIPISSPRRRQPTSTVPCAVWRNALLIRLRSIRSSICGSLYTQACVGTKHNSKPFCSASGRISPSSRASRSFKDRAAFCGVMSPACRRDMSSNSSSTSSSARAEADKRSSNGADWVGSRVRRSASISRWIACSGWRRSWLAAARKRDLAWSASSASCFSRLRCWASACFSRRSRIDSSMTFDNLRADDWTVYR